MKTLKFAVIAVLVAFTMASLANADGFKEKPKFKKVVNLTLEKALQNHGLVVAMYAQIDKDNILHNPQHVYIAMVVYQGNTYRITGTLDQWIRFFRMKGVKPVNAKLKGITN